MAETTTLAFPKGRVAYHDLWPRTLGNAATVAALQVVGDDSRPTGRVELYRRHHTAPLDAWDLIDSFGATGFQCFDMSTDRLWYICPRSDDKGDLCWRHRRDGWLVEHVAMADCPMRYISASRGTVMGNGADCKGESPCDILQWDKCRGLRKVLSANAGYRNPVLSPDGDYVNLRKVVAGKNVGRSTFKGTCSRVLGMEFAFSEPLMETKARHHAWVSDKVQTFGMAGGDGPGAWYPISATLPSSHGPIPKPDPHAIKWPTGTDPRIGDPCGAVVGKRRWIGGVSKNGYLHLLSDTGEYRKLGDGKLLGGDPNPILHPTGIWMATSTEGTWVGKL